MITEKILTASAQLTNFAKDNPDLIITVGRKAAVLVETEALSTPILHTLIPKAVYEKLWVSPHTERNSALFLEQPLERLINLAKIITPPKTNIGILLGPTNKHLKHELISHFSKDHTLGVQLDVINNKDEIGFKLRRLLKNSRTLLALPEPTVYNRKTARSILLSSYHNNVPVIGFSSSYVRAGALTAVFSTPEDIGNDTAHMVQQFILSKKVRLPEPAFPQSFHIRINDTVARSLGLNIADKEILRQQLIEFERR